MIDPNAGHSPEGEGALCDACSLGPSGVDGHAGLFTETLGNSLSLKCRECGALWKRLRANGEYAWEAFTQSAAGKRDMGVSVPPRSDENHAAGYLLSRFRLPRR